MITKYKTVKRQWKKNGEIVSQDYLYLEYYENKKLVKRERVYGDSYKELANITLVNKKGKLTKKGQKFLDDIKRTKSPEEYWYVEGMVRKLTKFKAGKSDVTAATLYSTMKETVIERLAFNAGFDLDELAEKLGVSREQIRNVNNWQISDKNYNSIKWGESPNVFKDPITGRIFDVEYDYYEGFVFNERENEVENEKKTN